jgi:toxin ParE1/3/4
MSYQIVRTDKANDQFYDILLYIAQANSPETALNYLAKLESAITQLCEFPYSGVVPRYGTLRKQGYRVLIAERHLVFYKVNDEKLLVTIHAVVDGRMEYKNLI